MGIQAVSPPKQQRESKYSYGPEDVKTAVEMLAALKQDADAPAPGDGPFETEGEARSAANAMVEAMGKQGSDVGTRVWADGKVKAVKRKRAGKEITVNTGEFYFSLKNGRKQRKQEENGSEPTEG